MPTAPKSISVLVYPADKTRSRLESIGTRKEDLTNPTLFYDGYVDSRQEPLAKTHTFLNAQTCLVQPLISLQPDACNKHWPREAWGKRAVISTTAYHVFFTVHSGNDLVQHPLFPKHVYGDVFVLKISDDTNEVGEKFYVDLDREEWKSKKVVWEDLAMEVDNVKNQYDQVVMEKFGNMTVELGVERTDETVFHC